MGGGKDTIPDSFHWKPKILLGHPVFIAQRDLRDTRVVCVDGDVQAGIDHLFEWVIQQFLDCACWIKCW